MTILIYILQNARISFKFISLYRRFITGTPRILGVFAENLLNFMVLQVMFNQNLKVFNLKAFDILSFHEK